MKHTIKIISLIIALNVAGLLHGAAAPNVSETMSFYVQSTQQQINKWNKDLKTPAINISSTAQQMGQSIDQLQDMIKDPKRFINDQHNFNADLLINYLRKRYKLFEGTLKPDTNKNINLAVFDPTGSYIIMATSNTLDVFNAQTRKKRNTLQQNSTIDITDIAFSPNGQYIALGVTDYTKRTTTQYAIQLRNAKTQSLTLLHQFKGHTNNIISIAFSPDGNLIASGAQDDTVKLWDIRTKQLIDTINITSGSIKNVIFTSPQTLLISTSQQIIHWSIQSKKALWKYPEAPTTISAATLNNSKTIMALAINNTIEIFNIDNAKPSSIKTYPNKTPIKYIVLSHDGTFITISPTQATIYDILTGDTINTFSIKNIISCSINPNNNQYQIIFVTQKQISIYGTSELFIDWIKNAATTQQIAYFTNKLNIPNTTYYKFTGEQEDFLRQSIEKTMGPELYLIVKNI